VLPPSPGDTIAALAACTPSSAEWAAFRAARSAHVVRIDVVRIDVVRIDVVRIDADSPSAASSWRVGVRRAN
jgi:hypothetical protein